MALVLVPAAAAFPLDGSLQSPTPLHLVGALAEESPIATAFVHPSTTQPAPGTVILRAERATLEIARIYAAGTHLEGAQITHETYDVTGAALEVARVEAAADLFLHARELGTLRIDAPACDVAENLEDPYSTMGLPTDSPSGVGLNQWNSFEENQLRADCRAEAVAAANPKVVRFYGVELFLTSHELTRTIRTGTFREAPIEGLPLQQPVTQILNVYSVDNATLSFDYPHRSSVTMYADAFLATGKLQVPTSQGRLSWGDLLRAGFLGAFEATGAFRIAWAPDHHIDVSGTTLNGPDLGGWVAPAPEPVTFELNVPLVVLAAGGVGLLGLLARVVWPLFTKLLPDRALEHPRRAQIIDYVRVQPGAEASRVARDLGIKWSSALYHIAALEQTGHLRVRRVDGRTALFPVDPAFHGREEQIALLRRPTFRRLYDALAAQPGLDQAALSAQLALGQPRVSKALLRLERASLVRRERTGRRTQYYAAGESPPAAPSAPMVLFPV